MWPSFGNRASPLGIPQRRRKSGAASASVDAFSTGAIGYDATEKNGFNIPNVIPVCRAVVVLSFPLFVLTCQQVTGQAPFTVDFVVRASAVGQDDDKPVSTGGGTTSRPFVSSATVSGWLAAGSRSFTEQFRQTFSLEDEGFEDRDVAAAKAALSNTLGGMGYFTGRSEVRGAGPNGGNGLSFEASLFTAVPSRSFFPRGFLWDEGFHQVIWGIVIK